MARTPTFCPTLEPLDRRAMLAVYVPVREVEGNDSAATSQVLQGSSKFLVVGRVATSDDVDSYSFTSTAGAHVALTARSSGAFAPRMTVHAPDGSLIATAATEGAGLRRAADFTFFAAAGGVYRVVIGGPEAGPGSGPATGGYALSIEQRRGWASQAVAPVEADVLTRLAIYEPASATPSVGDWQPLVAGDARLQGKNVYVVVHGWAVNYAGVPATNGTAANPLKWWQTIDHASLQPAAGKSAPPTEPVAAYMFLPQSGEDGRLLHPATQITPAGLASQLRQADPDAVVLAYSWVDDSATTLPGASESRTTLNGARLATALEQVLSTAGGGPRGLHLIGHSHGSKVATVAATLLRPKGVAVNQLTILDSPEQGPSVTAFNATNNLWYFLSALNVDRGQAAGTTFVDNYISQLDRRIGQIQGYDPFAASAVQVSTLQQVVDVSLNPQPIQRSAPSAFDSFAHRYAPAWYAGGSAGWSSNPTPTVANQWSPLVTNPGVTKPVPAHATQAWVTKTDPQFALTADAQPTTATVDPKPTPLALRPVSNPFRPQPPFTGSVTVSGNGQGQTVTKAYTFKTPSLSQTDSFGISFNLQFTAIEADDQLQITVNTGFSRKQETVFLMTAKQLGTGQGLATLSLGSLFKHPGPLGIKQIEFSIVPSAGSQGRTTVNVSNLKQFIVPGA